MSPLTPIDSIDFGRLPTDDDEMYCLSLMMVSKKLEENKFELRIDT